MTFTATTASPAIFADAVAALAAEVDGPVLMPGEDGYDDARAGASSTPTGGGRVCKKRAG
jgi:hypothetical protein